ncbi:5'-methylthioadenosine/S-adenosylhomocysteine nucleosidase [Metamycoplasma neophronis]|uniref:adenosylhomocysteine nucleosidase n=1 Tax=Metamycoplasma neophronis TaxID=872983 RepID=A0ABY2Z4U5_9BACT|nr:5'-methylthioadenosine/S-adenosylhomocysteine nucleosidase [Metamycoplasma neophronis]TPR54706.1 5'-methylthioadenosine/S-adenosylhomocysteine nucleosidase [Metamycoplasma neophronis]
MKLIVFAEKEEAQEFLKSLEIIEQIKLPFLNDYQGLLVVKNQSKKFYLGYSGVGKTNASQFLTYCLSKFNIESIINCGPAAAIESLSVGNVIVVSQSHYYDVDLTALPNYTLGKLPNLDTFFNCDWKFAEALDYERGNCATGDQFATQDTGELIKQNFPLTKVVDMECAAYNQVANNFNIPFNSIKIVSDSLSNTNNLEYIESKKIWENKIKEVLIKII